MAVDTRDKHIRRGRDEYTYALERLLPQGLAWPRESDSVLMRTVRGLAGIWAFIDSRAADLLERESDPRVTLELLPDWERAWGLPDHCLNEPLSVGDRQIALVNKMTMMGGQSRQWFIDLAHSIGYDITIREYAPWMFGVSEVGLTEDDTGYWRWEIASPEIRFYWTVTVESVRITWWRFGQAELGIDPHVRIGLATDLECLFRRYKPAHTQVIFDYTSYNRRYRLAEFRGGGALRAFASNMKSANARFAGTSSLTSNTVAPPSRAGFVGESRLLASHNIKTGNAIFSGASTFLVDTNIKFEFAQFSGGSNLYANTGQPVLETEEGSDLLFEGGSQINLV